MGKSAFDEGLCWLAARFAYQFNRTENPERPRLVVAYSLEQTRQVWLERQAFRMESGLDPEAYRAGLFNDEQWTLLETTVNRLSNVPLYINESPSVSVADVQSELFEISKDYDIRLVTLDFLQRMKEIQMAGADGRFQKIGDVAEGLADISKDVTFGHGPKVSVPLWALSQVKAPGGDRPRDDRPVMTDLYGSRQLEAAARMVLFLHRQDYYYDKTPGYVPNGEAELIVDKNNNGPTGVFKLAFDAKKVAFYEKVVGNS